MFLANKLNKGAGTPAAPADAQFNYVTMLLHGDGTNGAQNNTFVDSSTNNFTITRNGNTTQGSFSPYGSNWSNFNPDSDNGLGVATNTALNMGSGDFTVEAWVNTAKLPTTNAFQTSSGGYQSVFGTGPNSSSAGTQLYIGVTNLKFDINSDGSGPIDVAHNMVAGQWYHVAISRSSTTFKAFINGSLVQTATSGNSWVDGYSYGIMRAEPIGGYGGAWWYGYVSNLRLIKGTAIYTSSFTPSTTPLTAISGTSLLTCQSNRFIDNSTNNFAITVNGTPSVQRFNPFGTATAYSTSVIGGSGYFDGSGDYLSVGSNAVFGFGTGDFTVEYWVYPSLTGDSAQVVVDARPSDSASPWLIGHTTGGAVRYYDGSTVRTGGTMSANTWNHVAWTRSSDVNRVFLNGTQVSTYTASQDFGSSRGLTLGSNVLTSNEKFIGYVSNIRLVKGTAVYTSTFTPSTAPLTAISGTSLLTYFTNGAIFDNAMMNNLETAGNAQISTSVVKYGTGSMSFDGTGDALYSTSQATTFGTGDFTLEFWIYFNAVNNSTVKFIYDMRNSGATSASFLAQEVGNNWTYWNGAGTSISSGFTSSTFTASTWTHVAICRSSGTTRFFAGGTLANSASDTSNYANSTLTFGARYSISDALNGYIDDLRITKGFARYTANFTPPTAALPDIGPN
jgi:hypothetical protein